MNDEFNPNYVKTLLLTGYPKSGTTWLREIITCLISSSIKGDIAVPAFGKSFPTNNYLHMLGGNPTQIIRTHLVCSSQRFISSIQGINIDGVISIYRHPLDVLLSATNYARYHQDKYYFLKQEIKTVEQIIADNELTFYLKRFIEDDGCYEFSASSGPWSSFQQNWDVFANNIPHLRLCYEIMSQDAFSVAKQVAQFLKLEVTDHKISKALTTVERRTAQDGDFFWKKTAFNYKTLISKELADYFCQAFASQLTYLGYDQFN